MKKITLKIEEVALSELVLYKNNTKLHDKKQIQQIVASIKEFGFNDPLAIDQKTKTIIEGHGRYEAAKLLKLKVVPVIKLGHLSEAQRKAYAIAHNKLTMNTEFDEDKLKAELSALDNIDFDLELTGFDLEDIEKLLTGEGDDPGISGDTSPEDLPENFNVLVSCESEYDQQQLLEKIEQESYQCKALIS